MPNPSPSSPKQTRTRLAQKTKGGINAKTIEPNQSDKRKERGARGGGAVFFSENRQRWIWRAVVGYKPDGSVKYKEGRCHTQGKALDAKKKAEKGNIQPNDDKETTGEHLDFWLNSIAKPSVRPGTWARYEVVVRLHLKPNIGGVPLRKLTVSQVTKLWSDLAEGGMSTGTIRKCSEVLGTAMEAAVTLEKIAVAPTAGAIKPRVIEKQVEVFVDEQITTIMDASAGHRLEALFKLGIGTGAREGELLCLEKEDFDLIRGEVRITKTIDETKGMTTIVPPKSKAGIRTVSLPEFALLAVRNHLKGRGPGPAFTTATGTYLQRSNFIRQEWAPLLEKAHVSYRKFHTLRHTHASRLLQAGVDPAEVAKRIGDKIETLIRVYSHWIPANRQTAAQVDAIYNQSPKPKSFRAKVRSEKL
jgi:integrase